MVYQEKDKKKWTKDGRSWYYRCYYTNFSGERKQKKSEKYFTKREAQDGEREFLLTVQEQVDNKNMRFKDLYILFYDYQRNIKKVKDTTYGTYKDRVPYLQPLDNIKCIDFSLAHYQSWHKWVDSKQIANSYKNDIQKFLKAILNYGMEWHNFNFNNVYKKIKSFKDPNEIPKEMEFYTYEEFKQFIKYEDDLMWKTLFETLYYCGLRNGEMRALTWEDIDFNKCTVRINKQIPTRIGSRTWKFTSLKTQKSNRVLPLSKVLLKDLKLLYNEAKEYKNFNSKWFVFGNVLPMVADKPNDRQKTICNLSGIKKIRIHDFRHSCASLLISNGADITIVAMYLGHSKIDETLETYAHMYKNKLDNIINIIDGMDNINSILGKQDTEKSFVDKVKVLITTLFGEGCNVDLVQKIISNIEETIKNESELIS